MGGEATSGWRSIPPSVTRMLARSSIRVSETWRAVTWWVRLQGHMATRERQSLVNAQRRFSRRSSTHSFKHTHQCYTLVHIHTITTHICMYVYTYIHVLASTQMHPQTDLHASIHIKTHRLIHTERQQAEGTHFSRRPHIHETEETILQRTLSYKERNKRNDSHLRGVNPPAPTWKFRGGFSERATDL